MKLTVNGFVVMVNNLFARFAICWGCISIITFFCVAMYIGATPSDEYYDLVRQVDEARKLAEAMIEKRESEIREFKTQHPEFEFQSRVTGTPRRVTLFGRSRLYGVQQVQRVRIGPSDRFIARPFGQSAFATDSFMLQSQAVQVQQSVMEPSCFAR